MFRDGGPSTEPKGLKDLFVMSLLVPWIHIESLYDILHHASHVNSYHIMQLSNILISLQLTQSQLKST